MPNLLGGTQRQGVNVCGRKLAAATRTPVCVDDLQTPCFTATAAPCVSSVRFSVMPERELREIVVVPKYYHHLIDSDSYCYDYWQLNCFSRTG